MECIFLNAAGTTLFVRDDMESGHWVQEQMNMTADFPFDPAKKIERGMRIAFRDPATDSLEVFEVKIVANQEPEHYQQITAENIALSELTDEHINTTQITSQTAAQALATALTGTLWSVGDVNIGSPEERADIQQRIDALSLNGNVDLTNRPIISPETMHEAGYTDFDGDYATLYSMTFTETLSGGQLITTLFTPIRVNGTVLSPDQIEDYVITLHGNSASISALKANDTQGLLMHALSGEQIDEMEEIAVEAHELSDEWEVCTTGGVQSADFSRGSVWDAVSTIQQNWNVYIAPRVVISSAGAIIGRYLDITLAEGVWRGVRLSVRKNMLDPAVTYDDEDVYTALYGYGGNVEKPQTSGDDKEEELTFASVAWSATSSHPAKPSGQTYLEWPEKTAIYGRNGRPRYGYYQNGNIKDAELLLEKTWESLKQSCEPKISITGTVVDLYRLGYHDEPIQLHDIVIVEIEETGETFQKQIITCDIDLIDPTGSRVDVGDYIPNIIYINRETDKKASGGGGGGGRGAGSMTNLEDEEIKAYTTFYNDGRRIGMIVATKNGTDYINAPQISIAINESGEEGSYTTTAYIQANHVDISATDTVHTLAGDLEHDAQGRLVIKNAGGMYAERTEQGTTSYFGIWDEGNLTGGVMVNQINGQQGTKLTLQADVIDIDGLILALYTKDLTCNNMNINGTAYMSDADFDGNITQSSGYAYFLELRVGTSTPASWQSKQISTPTYGTRRYFLYSAGSGDTTPSGTTRHYPITAHTETTIHYLGSADT